ncbi:hypothetical protein AYI69_g7988 [Smittium culicis]|uniref:Uncharacterized protein n=1 Tax=Smittium culicis TaxID=133412 RepID=A0A1R1XN31_9FUNG|nr:hypothetical protein AYI69_g7988 [Smittium culicis]
MDSATKLMMIAPYTANNNKKYGFCQKKFMEWRAKNNLLDIKISVTDIIRFFEAKIIKNNLKVSTIFIDRSSLLSMVKGPKKNLNDGIFKQCL